MSRSSRNQRSDKEGHLARKKYGAEQQAKVRERIRTAMASVAAEMQRCTDPETGRPRYPQNKGRFSKAELLRRAQVDKNTINLRRYHKDLRTQVESFVLRIRIQLGAAKEAARHTAPSTRLGRRAALAEQAEEIQALRRMLADRDAKISKLQTQTVRTRAVSPGP